MHGKTSIPLLLFLSALTTLDNVTALNCTTCYSKQNFTACDNSGAAKQCTADVVRQTHLNLANLNQELPLAVVANVTEFKCFRVEVHSSNTSDNDLGAYTGGCTYNATDFCHGWRKAVTVVSCGTCAEDNCKPVEKTVPVIPSQPVTHSVSNTSQQTGSPNNTTANPVTHNKKSTAATLPNIGLGLLAMITVGLSFMTGLL